MNELNNFFCLRSESAINSTSYITKKKNVRPYTSNDAGVVTASPGVFRQTTRISIDRQRKQQKNRQDQKGNQKIHATEQNNRVHVGRSNV